MMPTTPYRLNDEQRATLAALADELIPAEGEMPSASQVDVPGVLVDAVLRSRPDLGPDLAAVLDGAAGTPPAAALDDLARSDADALGTLRFVVAGAYLMDRRVGDLIGYHGQEAKQVDPNSHVAYITDGLLDPVVERGAIFRPSPDRDTVGGS